MSDLTSDKLCTNYVCYCAGIRFCSLGSAIEGGYLILKEGGVGIILAPCTTRVIRTWSSRNDAVITAEANAACGDWFVPTKSELNCYRQDATYWDCSESTAYWSDTPNNTLWAWAVGCPASAFRASIYCSCRVIAFRRAYY